MESRATVTHEGIVELVSGSHIRVRFVAQSACAACHAKGVCSVSDSEDKFVDVESHLPGLSAGDRVEVILAQSQGLKAVWYGYGLPLVILLLVIFVLNAITGREGFSALIGLGSLIPYYLVVYLFRKRISRSIEFILRKTE
ncbi:MAG: SoxR reducing system RseC family protein [Bacteroidales bacterium]|jgi:sigma-E factor negative regulatory protein RseC